MSEPLDLVRADLAQRFVGVGWVSPEMSEAFNRYLLQLLQQIGVRVALMSLSPQNADLMPLEEPAVRLGAVQQLDQSGRQELLRSAWMEAHGEQTTPTGLHKDWLTEILLETAHRLRKV